ncbi:pentapeptide repeat-containing protein [Gordonia tangerina]|uniref:Pentapeptide repeat-containing protein n=1 Tax=Gordonia tangerina TaxID=2911060 RepID=A0ABS9DK19_9ACTN|nr:pentapeptide repeat-containing protein [Gordonia tangerina]MCF3939567.1 pentapeptide repeat-containing protein [Gordonia tangerina]
MEPITPAEYALLVATEADEACDLRTSSERADPTWVPSIEAATGPTDDRKVRADYLRHLMLDQQLSIHLIGARIDGNLDLSGSHALTVNTERCVYTGNARFDRTTFTGNARFDRTTFTGDATFGRAIVTGDATFSGAVFTGKAWFSGATFTGDAWFYGATFTGDAEFYGATFTGIAGLDGVTFTGKARFGGATFTEITSFRRAWFTGDAWFSGATFTGDADFDGATFTGDAGFDGATFTRYAWFREATFTGDAWFYGATFTGDAGFDGATFTGDAGFDGATFTRGAGFDGATFTRGAGFDGATFTRGAGFDGATFTGDTRFGHSRWRVLDWSATTWKTASVVTTGLAAETVTLDQAVFEEPVQLELAAAQITMKRTRATTRLHMVVAGATVDLEDADLAEGSLIEAAPVTVPTSDGKGSVPGGGSWVPIPQLRNEHGGVDVPHGMLLHQWLGHILALLRLDRDLSTALSHAPSASVKSLKRAHIAGTTLSGMALRACTFTGADGLDKLIITGEGILTNNRGEKDKTRPWPAYGRKWWRTGRRVLHDERGLRDPHATTDATDTSGEPATTPTAPLTHRNVSATYRSLRKALEDSKDEPGAADFYYGEMETRRLAATPFSVERSLLTLYGLVSGYGLRAWRALASLVALVGVASLCFIRGDNPFIPWEWVRTTTPATTPVIDPDSVVWPLAFGAQETIALFRPAGAVGVTLVGFGVVVDIIVRILGPVLLALAVLAIRNRTKR